MSKVLNEVMAANGRYADEFGDKAKLPMPPARRFAILTCMDARLDPAKFAGLAEGDAHVIRNAGGRASDDAIRSLVISHKLLGTREWFVIHHTDCGMETFTNEIMRGLLASSLETATIDQRGWRDTGKGPGSSEGRYIDWLTIDDNARSVVEDVARIRNHPLVNKSIPVHGYIYDVKSGRLMEVAEASRAGGVTSAKARRSTKAAKAPSAKAPKAGKAKKAAATKVQKTGKARKAASTKAQKSRKDQSSLTGLPPTHVERAVASAVIPAVTSGLTRAARCQRRPGSCSADDRPSWPRWTTSPPRTAQIRSATSLGQTILNRSNTVSI